MPCAARGLLHHTTQRARRATAASKLRTWVTGFVHPLSGANRLFPRSLVIVPNGFRLGSALNSVCQLGGEFTGSEFRNVIVPVLPREDNPEGSPKPLGDQQHCYPSLYKHNPSQKLREYPAIHTNWGNTLLFLLKEWNKTRAHCRIYDYEFCLG